MQGILFRILKSALPEVLHMFSCEKEQFKRRFMRSHIKLKNDWCLFKDATELIDDEKRFCVVHEAACDSWLLQRCE